MKYLLTSLYALIFSMTAAASPMTAQFTNQASANRPYLLGFTLAVVCLIVILLVWTRKR